MYSSVGRALVFNTNRHGFEPRYALKYKCMKKVVEIRGDLVKIDMNHPLAGKKLTFEVKMEKITKAGDFEEVKEENCSDDGCDSCSSCGGH